jgi:hypothetical protein
MTTDTVKVIAPPVCKYADSSHFEAADSALRGALALNCVIQDVTTGESAGTWANFVVDDLHGASRALLQSARLSLDLLRHENWLGHALLGEYGSEAKAKAEAEAEAGAIA